MEAAAASEVMEGPVIAVISKRIRALRKKLNRISQMEESVSNGKTLNKEQEETLRSKPSVIAGIEELEKLIQPLTAAVGEEISLAIQRHQVSVPKSEASVDASPNREDKSDQVTEDKVEISTIEPNTNVTNSGVRLKLKKIFDSQYSTASPVLNFGTHQVQVQESIPSVDVQVHVEGAGMQHQQKEEPFVLNENGTNNGEAGEEQHREVEDSPDLTVETVSVHPPEGLEDPVDVKEQHVSRQSYNNNNNYYRGGSRGGRHRGNYNGRGGRGREAATSYQNGGHGQYYDQPGNYRSRNFEHRGSGGRGGRGGGYYNNHHHHNNHRAYGGGEGGGPGAKYNRDS